MNTNGRVCMYVVYMRGVSACPLYCHMREVVLACSVVILHLFQWQLDEEPTAPFT
jgi:hypothetical protein